MGDSRKTRRELENEISRDFSQFASEFVTNLRATTPIQSGNARRGWVNKYNNSVGKSTRFEVAANHVPYIGPLDTGTSRQAPRGIVKPAFDKTRKPR